MSEIGQGGSARIYLARDNDLGREVAIKRLRNEVLSPNVIARTMREFRITAQLEHPSIIPVYGFGDSDGCPFLVMKYIRGRTLMDVSRLYHEESVSDWRDPQISRLMNALAQAVDAIAFAHANGIIHRDPKPSNVLIGMTGESYLCDWGLAKRICPEHSVRGCPIRVPEPTLGA